MLTNIFPIELDFDSFQISRLPYSTDQLSQLRKLHNTTHSFFKNENFIYISRNEGDDINVGTTVTLDVDQSDEVLSSLIKHVFFRNFKSAYPDIIPLSFYPFSFVSRNSKHDFIYNLLPDDLKGVIGFKK